MRIDRLANSGEGVASHDGRAVFVEGAFPEETVVVEVTPGKVQRGAVVELVEPHPARREPPCALASTCGGCDWLAVDEAAQLRFKEAMVVSTLAHAGGIASEGYTLLPAVGGQPGLGVRRRATLHPVGRELGFFGRRSHLRVPVSSCPALTPPAQSLPSLLASALGTSLKDIEEVRILESDARLAVSVHTTSAPRPKLRESLQKLVDERLLASAIIVPPDANAHSEVMGAAALEEEGVFLRPDAFTQAHQALNRQLVAHAVDVLEVEKKHTVLELYSGNGNFTFPLAARAAEVLAVESSPVSVALAQRGARRFSNVRLMQIDAEAAMKGLMRESKRFDRLFVDPPRAGCPPIADWASRLLVERVVYVACDPTSLARDAKRLAAAGFRPESLRVFDLFPQTHHVEAVMSFARG
ncbi:MAG: class I SAM-dependent RNA methyltransferase [Archangium sp.]|nr:class I SAM-dependent RNA methyltransferase [Archangium sp.]